MLPASSHFPFRSFSLHLSCFSFFAKPLLRLPLSSALSPLLYLPPFTFLFARPTSRLHPRSLFSPTSIFASPFLYLLPSSDSPSASFFAFTLLVCLSVALSAHSLPIPFPSPCSSYSYSCTDPHLLPSFVVPLLTLLLFHPLPVHAASSSSPSVSRRRSSLSLSALPSLFPFANGCRAAALPELVHRGKILWRGSQYQQHRCRWLAGLPLLLASPVDPATPL